MVVKRYDKKKTDPSILQNFDTEIAELIAKNRGISEMDALRIFLASKTHEMLEDDEMKIWYFQIHLPFMICGKMKKPQEIREIPCICEVMKLNKEFRFLLF